MSEIVMSFFGHFMVSRSMDLNALNHKHVHDQMAELWTQLMIFYGLPLLLVVY